jgi:hypothetical protein
LVIKPLEEDHTPGTVKPFQVSLVEPVAYPLSYSFRLVNSPPTGDDLRRRGNRTSAVMKIPLQPMRFAKRFL